VSWWVNGMAIILIVREQGYLYQAGFTEVHTVWGVKDGLEDRVLVVLEHSVSNSEWHLDSC